MKRGDVVLLVAQGSIGKPRPGVIVQADELGEATTTILVCSLSSDLTEFRRSRPVVEPTAGNGLLVRSQVMTDKINALRRSQIRRTLGSLSLAATENLDRALLIVLGLAR